MTKFFAVVATVLVLGGTVGLRLSAPAFAGSEVNDGTEDMSTGGDPGDSNSDTSKGGCDGSSCGVQIDDDD